eukprot:gene27241-2496_t
MHVRVRQLALDRKTVAEQRRSVKIGCFQSTAKEPAAASKLAVGSTLHCSSGDASGRRPSLRDPSLPKADTSRRPTFLEALDDRSVGGDGRASLCTTPHRHSFLPVARKSSYGRKINTLPSTPGTSTTIGDVKATDRFVVDQLKGNVFINEYHVIKDLGRGAHGTVKLVYNTEDSLLSSFTTDMNNNLRASASMRDSPKFKAQSDMISQLSTSLQIRGSELSTTGRICSMASSAHPSVADFTRDLVGDSEYANEIEVMTELDHENVVKLYEVIASREQNKLMMVMEYVEGGSVLEGDDPYYKAEQRRSVKIGCFQSTAKELAAASKLAVGSTLHCSSGDASGRRPSLRDPSLPKADTSRRPTFLEALDDRSVGGDGRASLCTTPHRHSFLPVARKSSYGRKINTLPSTPGTSTTIGDVKATDRFVVDQLKPVLHNFTPRGNVFINEYHVIKDLGRGAHGTVKLVYNTEDSLLSSFTTDMNKNLRASASMRDSPKFKAQSDMISQLSTSLQIRGSELSTTGRICSMASSAHPSVADFTRDLVGDSEYANEIEVMTELDHENVVKLYEVIASREQNKLMMVMEYVEGGSVLEGDDPYYKDPIPEATAGEYFTDIVQGLEYLHFNGVVHGDLKPDNLLITMNAKVKISDFGSARWLESEDTLLIRSLGTPAFMSPEMCASKPFNGFLGDVWALGVCLYMFVYGSPPFGSAEASAHNIYRAILNDDVKLLPTNKLKQPISSPLRDLLSRVLQKNPLKRATLEEVMKHPWVSMARKPEVDSVQRVVDLVRKSGAATKSSKKAKAKNNDVDATKLPGIIPEGELRVLKKGEHLFKRGEVPEGLFVVIEGDIELSRLRVRGRYVEDADFADHFSEDDSDSSKSCLCLKTASKHLEGLKMINILKYSLYSNSQNMVEDTDEESAHMLIGDPILDEDEDSINDDYFSNQLPSARQPKHSPIRSQYPRRTGYHSLQGQETLTIDGDGSPPSAAHKKLPAHTRSLRAFTPASKESESNFSKSATEAPRVWHPSPTRNASGRSLAAGLHAGPSRNSRLSMASGKTLNSSGSHRIAQNPKQSRGQVPLDPELLNAAEGEFSFPECLSGKELDDRKTALANMKSPTEKPLLRSQSGSTQPSHRSSMGITSCSLPSARTSGNSASMRSNIVLSTASSRSTTSSLHPLLQVRPTSTGSVGTSSFPPLSGSLHRSTQSELALPTAAELALPTAGQPVTGPSGLLYARSIPSSPLCASSSPNVHSADRLSTIAQSSDSLAESGGPNSCSAGRLPTIRQSTSSLADMDAPVSYSAGRLPTIRQSPSSLVDKEIPTSYSASRLPTIRQSTNSLVDKEIPTSYSAGRLPTIRQSTNSLADMDVPASYSAGQLPTIRQSTNSLADMDVPTSYSAGRLPTIKLSSSSLHGLHRLKSTSIDLPKSAYVPSDQHHSSCVQISPKLSLQEPPSSCPVIAVPCNVKPTWSGRHHSACTLPNIQPIALLPGYQGGVPRTASGSASLWGSQLPSRVSPARSSILSSRPSVVSSRQSVASSRKSAGSSRQSVASSRKSAGSSQRLGSRFSSSMPVSMGEGLSVIVGDQELPVRGMDYEGMEVGDELGDINTSRFSQMSISEHTNAFDQCKTAANCVLNCSSTSNAIDDQSGPGHLRSVNMSAAISSRMSTQLRRAAPEMQSTMYKMQKVLDRTDSMHKRMALMVLRAKEHARMEMRKGKIMTISTRGPGAVVGDVFLNEHKKPSEVWVRASSDVVKVLLLRHDVVQDNMHQPLVRAAVNRSHNSLLVQESIERFIECENEVNRADSIRRMSNMFLPSATYTDTVGENGSMEPMTVLNSAPIPDSSFMSKKPSSSMVYHYNRGERNKSLSSRSKKQVSVQLARQSSWFTVHDTGWQCQSSVHSAGSRLAMSVQCSQCRIQAGNVSPVFTVQDPGWQCQSSVRSVGSRLAMSVQCSQCRIQAGNVSLVFTVQDPGWQCQSIVRSARSRLAMSVQCSHCRIQACNVSPVFTVQDPGWQCQSSVHSAGSRLAMSVQCSQCTIQAGNDPGWQCQSSVHSAGSRLAMSVQCSQCRIQAGNVSLVFTVQDPGCQCQSSVHSAGSRLAMSVQGSQCRIQAGNVSPGFTVQDPGWQCQSSVHSAGSRLAMFSIMVARDYPPCRSFVVLEDNSMFIPRSFTSLSLSMCFAMLAGDCCPSRAFGRWLCDYFLSMLALAMLAGDYCPSRAFG